jgi:hypothetical protein
LKVYGALLGAAAASAAVSLWLLMWPGAEDDPPPTALARPAQAGPINRAAGEGEPWILFLSRRSGRNVLYRMRPGGGEAEPIFGGELEGMPGLPEGTAWCREPHWSRQSPDGRFFISHALDRGLPPQRFGSPPRFLLHLGRMEGGPTRLITPDAGEVFAWAPDSRRFAYARTLWGHPATLAHPVEPATELIIAPIDGGNEEIVLDRPGIWVPHDWSPDGARLLASRATSPILQEASTALYELDLAAVAGARPEAEGAPEEGRGLRAILPMSRAIGCSSARYSPDGEEIAAICSALEPEPGKMIDPSRFAASFELKLLDRAGGAPRTVFRAPDIFGGPICWSPDGRRILFARFNSPEQAAAPEREPADDALTIWSIGRDGEGPRPLAGGWCPDWRAGAGAAKSPAPPRQTASARDPASHPGGPAPADDPEQAATRLKQFGLGLAEFQRARGASPALGRSRLPVDRQASWVVRVLPQLGRGDLRDRIHSAPTDGEDRPWDDPSNREAVGTVLEALVTPEMASSGIRRDPSGAGLTGFVGISGTGPASPGLPEGSDDPARGFFGYHRIARPSEVADGLSSTAVVMEARSQRGPWAQNGPSTVRPIESFEGGLVLMADGSVRVLARTTDPGVLRALSTIAAGDERRP